MVLFLAASDNILLIDARKKIQQNFSIPTEIRYDFKNFPLLNSKKSSNSKLQSETQSAFPQTNNRYSIFNSSNIIEDSTDFTSNNKSRILTLLSVIIVGSKNSLTLRLRFFPTADLPRVSMSVHVQELIGQLYKSSLFF